MTSVLVYTYACVCINSVHAMYIYIYFDFVDLCHSAVHLEYNRCGEREANKGYITHGNCL